MSEISRKEEGSPDPIKFRYKVDTQFVEADNSKTWDETFKKITHNETVKNFVENFNGDNASVPLLKYKLTRSEPNEELRSQQIKRNNFKHNLWNVPDFSAKNRSENY